jgi:hypothetical protein
VDSGRKVYEKILAQGGKPGKTAGIVLSREEVSHLRRYLLGLSAKEEIAMFGGFGRAWRVVSALRDQRPCMIANCTIGYERRLFIS